MSFPFQLPHLSLMSLWSISVNGHLNRFRITETIHCFHQSGCSAGIESHLSGWMMFSNDLFSTDGCYSPGLKYGSICSQPRCLLWVGEERHREWPTVLRQSNKPWSTSGRSLYKSWPFICSILHLSSISILSTAEGWQLTMLFMTSSLTSNPSFLKTFLWIIYWIKCTFHVCFPTAVIWCYCKATNNSHIHCNLVTTQWDSLCVEFRLEHSQGLAPKAYTVIVYMTLH